jgi:uroporphyrinogen decarboxylase
MKRRRKIMTGRERLLCTLQHKEPDMVPIFEWLYSRPIFQEVLGFVPETFHMPSVFKCCEKIGYDFAFVPFLGLSGFRPEKICSDVYQDEWGITCKRDLGTWPIDSALATPLKNGRDWKHYSMPNPNEDWRYRDIREVMKISKENGMGVIGNVRGPYSGSWMLFGMENFSYLLYDDPETVDAVLTAMTDFAIDAAGRMVKEGVDAILFSDDYGSSTQPLFSVEHFQRYIKPQIKRISLAVRKMGIPLIMHSDGCITPFVGDCVDAGIEGMHPIERDAGMDLAYIKKTYGDKICIFGNVNNKKTLVFGTLEEIEAQVRECISIAAPGGGYCLGSDHSVHDDIPNRNVFALYEAGRKFGKYPI